MDQNGGTDYSAGASDTGYQPGSTDTGNQGGTQDTNTQGGQGTSGGQGGQQTDTRDAEVSRMRQEIQRLNKALVDSRRNGNRQQPGQQDGQDPFESPEGRYALSLQLATSELRNKMEDVFSLYPEIPASEIARIRKNPWAFASHQSYIAGDYEGAAMEIEQAMLDRAEEIAKDKGGAGGQLQPGQTQQPARINTNPNQEPAAPVTPGSAGDQNPWTMPMDKLEATAKAEVAKKTKKS